MTARTKLRAAQVFFAACLAFVWGTVFSTTRRLTQATTVQQSAPLPPTEAPLFTVPAPNPDDICIELGTLDGGEQDMRHWQQIFVRRVPCEAHTLRVSEGFFGRAGRDFK